MSYSVSKTLKRYNYLFGETGTAYHEIYLKLGMSDSAIAILYAILENGDCCLLRDICHYTGMSKQTVNSSLRKLEEEKILYRELVDGKNKMIHLTQEGKILAERTAGRVLATEDEIFASWPPEDVQKYLELTENFMLALKEKAKTIPTLESPGHRPKETASCANN